MYGRTASQTARTESRSSHYPQPSLAGKIEVVEAETAKRSHALAHGVIDASIEAVLFEGPSTARDKVIQQVRVGRLRKKGKDVSSLR